MLINLIKDRISKELLISFIIQGLYTVLSPLSMILLARFLGADLFGVFAFAISIVTILSMIAELGLPIVITRYATVYYIKKQLKLLKGIIKFTNERIIMASCFIIAVTLGFYYFNIIDETYAKAIVLSSPLVVLLALSRVRSAILTAIHKVNIAQLPEMILRPFLLIILVLLLYYFGYVTIYNVLIIYILINIIVYFSGEVLVRSSTKQLNLKGLQLKFDKRNWINTALPLFFLGGIQIIGAQSDVFLLGVLSNSTDVGVFKSMYQISLLVIFSLSAVNAIAPPLVIKDFENKNHEGLKQLLFNFCGINFISALIIASPLFFFGKFFIELLYGQEYIVGYSCLQILIIGRVINTTLGVSNQFLKMMGEEKKATKGIMIGIILGVVLNVILIPYYGIIGAAIAAAGSLITWNIYLFMLLLRKLKSI